MLVWQEVWGAMRPYHEGSIWRVYCGGATGDNLGERGPGWSGLLEHRMCMWRGSQEGDHQATLGLQGLQGQSVLGASLEHTPSHVHTPTLQAHLDRRSTLPPAVFL